ncbi:hypothetical protein SAMN05444373_101239 [Thermoclostridium caenicola]|uniref:Uncharacterized protein n=1 Tax=Thermoclostridium caenicola TaxID=659425 RepID=A0A1M6EJ61_9FIRM|nr:hypothetical protein SAMN05444373_101239 [Thermoclostridium caenicola]
MRFCQLNASTISSFLESIEFITSQISIWGATLTFFFYTYDEPISIRAPRKGAAGLPRPGPAHPGYFNPRSPYGERLPRHVCLFDLRFISIHAPHTGSDAHGQSQLQQGHISIHAPHTGSDGIQGFNGQYPANFNPRSPYGERRRSLRYTMRPLIFQSTLPIRGATIGARVELAGERISIHAPHTGSDIPEWRSAGWTRIFQSTLPIRGATSHHHLQLIYRGISLHAPHTGSDRCCEISVIISGDFNPRSPYGERRFGA